MLLEKDINNLFVITRSCGRRILQRGVEKATKLLKQISKMSGMSIHCQGAIDELDAKRKALNGLSHQVPIIYSL